MDTTSAEQLWRLSKFWFVIFVCLQCSQLTIFYKDIKCTPSCCHKLCWKLCPISWEDHRGNWYLLHINEDHGCKSWFLFHADVDDSLQAKTGGDDGVYVNYPWVIIFVSTLFSYISAHCFISVYGMSIDTIFLCFCEDSSRNDGINKPYFMSKVISSNWRFSFNLFMLGLDGICRE